MGKQQLRYYDRIIKPNPERMEALRSRSREYQRVHRLTPEHKAKKRAYDVKPETKARRVGRDKRNHLQRVFKLSSDQFEAMVRDCNRRCPICKTPFSTILRERPVVDHCHRTGLIRGVICGRCNLMVGHALDNPTILRAAARYLQGTAKQSSHVVDLASPPDSKPQPTRSKPDA